MSVPCIRSGRFVLTESDDRASDDHDLVAKGDIDSHSGGIFKMANSVSGLGRKSTRLGTYGEQLSWIGR